jgi:hypothetical protein
MRRIRCPLRHAARALAQNFFSEKISDKCHYRITNISIYKYKYIHREKTDPAFPRASNVFDRIEYLKHCLQTYLWILESTSVVFEWFDVERKRLYVRIRLKNPTNRSTYTKFMYQKNIFGTLGTMDRL